jgi:alpha-ketoglutarate-dependent taurine dioxygenase
LDEYQSTARRSFLFEIPSLTSLSHTLCVHPYFFINTDNMAPSAIDVDIPVVSKNVTREPLKLSGALDSYESFDVTPVIGREFPTANLNEWLTAPNSDELLRDLAITISQRGVVFFRAQDGLTNELQKQLILRLGELAGRPATSGLHIHPILNSERELGGSDPEISTISSIQNKKFYSQKPASDTLSPKKQSSAQWHSDIAFEPVPADYTSLRLVELPSTGGDTLWASGYEIYDRISEPYQKFLEGLTATFEQPLFRKVAEDSGFQLYDKPRGAPENVGSELKAIHPVVRTNPVTGWKSIFPVGGHVKHINGLTEEESSKLLSWFLDLVYKNHDLQVRLKWKNPNDIAIWDNRSVFHTATFDYVDGNYGERFGNRAVGLGERPYLDPNSTSRRAAVSND